MLHIRSLAKIYPGPVTALHGVDLDLPVGLFGLLGPNGAGKSTLMKVLAGLLEPTGGAVTLDGVDVLAEPDVLWRQLGYLPQDFGFYEHLSGEAMLTYLLELKGVDGPKGSRALARELLDRVNLGFAAKRKVGAYSGGMRQRLGIAQAIAGEPRLLIVDEPTVGLDPEERLRLYRLLAELAEERIVLLSTHLVEDVAMLCPRFAVLRQGRLVAVTTPEDAKASLGDAIVEGEVDGGALDDFAERFRVTQSILVAGRHRLRLGLRDGESAPDGFRPVPASLEDAYFVLMRDVGAVAPPTDGEQPTEASA
ncbi:MAG: ATP-binding cassette domain-containing protein [Acidobacteriota bacterium]